MKSDLQQTTSAGLQSQLFNSPEKHLTLSEASAWASAKTDSNVTLSNIQYLIKYGSLSAIRNNGVLVIDFNDLEEYFSSKHRTREESYKAKLGDDINWNLSFDRCKESETTKHVHRLHPYKGKFIPQLVEYFLDDHADEFKTDVIFKAGDLILDPFCGSGTTLVQANELGMHAVGVDVSAFNSLICKLKLANINAIELMEATVKIGDVIASSGAGINARRFEAKLAEKLVEFNAEHFPAPEFRQNVKRGKIDEDRYGKEKATEFLIHFENLQKEFGLETKTSENDRHFLDRWFVPSILEEFRCGVDAINKFEDVVIANALRLILSRTARSCRATKHHDLATLVEPVCLTYYCSKHSKICKPLFSSLKWWKRYAVDTVRRIGEFARLRTDTHQVCLTGDSRSINICRMLRETDRNMHKIFNEQKIRGIFSSPPYVGLINYHEQHEYAYELFGFSKNDGAEIGPLSRGQGKQARRDYVESIAKVLINCRRFMIDEFDIFLVANDKFDLYPEIAAQTDLKIAYEYKRPVLNRAEGNKGAYSESIFHMVRG